MLIQVPLPRLVRLLPGTGYHHSLDSPEPLFFSFSGTYSKDHCYLVRARLPCLPVVVVIMLFVMVVMVAAVRFAQP